MENMPRFTFCDLLKKIKQGDLICTTYLCKSQMPHIIKAKHGRVLVLTEGEECD